MCRLASLHCTRRHVQAKRRAWEESRLQHIARSLGVKRVTPEEQAEWSELVKTCVCPCRLCSMSNIVNRRNILFTRFLINHSKTFAVNEHL